MNRITHHVPLRSSMALCTNVVTDKHPWNRSDILRDKSYRDKRAKLFDNLRPKYRSFKKFAVVKKSGMYFHVVGLGKVRVKTFEGLKKVCKKNNFTHIRLGAIKTEIK